MKLNQVLIGFLKENSSPINPLMNYRYLLLFIFGFFFVYFVLNRKTELQVQKEVVSNKIKTLVVHVTREFQPLVTYGGLGSVLGSIAKYQTESQDLDSWIIIPFYTFLSFINRNEDKITEVTIQYKDRIIIGKDIEIITFSSNLLEKV